MKPPALIFTYFLRIHRKLDPNMDAAAFIYRFIDLTEYRTSVLISGCAKPAFC